jgi:membrane protein implicated in regulation of membrane protease activity
MHLVALAWIYVVLMMAVAEALSPVGSVLGALITFVLYGVLPLSIVLYILGTPMRRRARRRQEALAADPDGGGHAAGAPVAPVREEP